MVELVAVLETQKTKITALINNLKDALGQEKEASNFSHQELVSMLSQLDNLIVELVDAFNKVSKQQSEMISRLEKRIESYQIEISQLKEEASQIKMRVEKLEGSKQRLLLGQLAFKLDKVFLAKVLKKSECDADDLYYIKDMVRAIKCQEPYNSVFKDDDERQRVKLCWCELEAKLGWKNEHTIGLKNLKRLRLNDAHPEFSTDEMEAAIAKASRNEKEKRICHEFLKMLKILEEM